ncbi:MAG: hypothetical protein US76_03715 [Parcubacteria group bacterium GW2011_GWA2_38_13b]|nr:MAG: hypothetical protein US76_03715 [Parcubacteria group bacterium GW2011_GWA2_38_13b]
MRDVDTGFLCFNDFLLPVSKIYRQRGGFNSEVLHSHQENGDKKIIKRIGDKRGGFTIARAEEIAGDIIEYQKKLSDLGVVMPAIEKISIEYNYLEKQSAMVLMETKWVGFDAEMYIEKTNDRGYISKLVEDIYGVLRLVFDNRVSGLETLVGIDPKPSNFTIDGNGKVWYVDPFPPRYRKNGKPIIEWFDLKTQLGNELGYFKYFDVRGIVLGFMEQLGRIKPSLKILFEEYVLREFADAGLSYLKKDFFAEFQNTPWRKFHDVLGKDCVDKSDIKKAKEIIQNSLEDKIFGVDYNVYTLRELALELAFFKKMTIDEMESFFKRSHFEEEINKKRIDNLKNMLCCYL